MKRALTMLLLLVMALSLFACGGTTAPATTTAPPATNNDDGATAPPPPPTANTEEAGRDTMGEVGFYDPDYDYTQNPRYKFVYLMVRSSVLYEDFANSFRVWGNKMNVDVEMTDTNGDNDLFITSIETLAAQGYDGLLLDPDMTTYPAVIEKCNEVGIKWMPVMGLPYGEDGLLKHPFVGFDYYLAGVKMGEWLLDYQQKNWPDAKPEEIGVLGVDYSVVYEISCRIDGALEAISKAYPDIYDRYFHADCIVGNLDSSTAYQESGAILPTQPNIKYWLIVGTVDDFADGAVTAAVDAGIENCVAISMGSPGLVAQWDAGEQTAWKASLSSIGVIYAEPIFCGLYAQVIGQATAEELWVPEWVDNSKGESYANLLLPTIILEYENYQYYKEWIDIYAGVDISSYPVTATRDMFNARVNPPASYKG